MAPKWHHEDIPDHKFDYINIKDFRHQSFTTWVSYAWNFVVIAKTIAIYAFDIQTAVFLLAYDKWSENSVKPAIPFKVSKWLYSSCIFLSFILLAKDWWDGRKVIISRDISLAYTNIIAHRWYTCKSYDYHCLFVRISKSDKLTHSIAIFVFFSYKGWKRMFFAEGPRQAINAITLYSVAKSVHFSTDFSKYYHTTIQAVVLIFMTLSLIIWMISVLQVIVATCFYLPLLCFTIQGNLKEFVCHIVDLRITQLLAKNRKKRMEIVELQKFSNISRSDTISTFGSSKSYTTRDNYFYSSTSTERLVNPKQPTLPKIDLVELEKKRTPTLPNVDLDRLERQQPYTSYPVNPPPTSQRVKPFDRELKQQRTPPPYIDRRNMGVQRKEVPVAPKQNQIHLAKQQNNPTLPKINHVDLAKQQNNPTLPKISHVDLAKQQNPTLPKINLDELTRMQ